MDKEHIKGEAIDTRGDIKETVGKMTGNKKLEADGKKDQVEGKARKVAGDVKDAVKHAAE